MGKPIIVVAGQSNVAVLSEPLRQAMDIAFGADGYHLVRVFEPGAPLTWARPGGDWASAGELPSDLVAQTEWALLDNPGSFLGGVIWLQGEADTYAFADAQAYGAAFTSLFDGFRARLIATLGADRSGAEQAGIVIAELSDQAPAAPGRANWAQIVATQAALAHAPGISSVDPDTVAAENGLPAGAMFSDALHYAPAFAAPFAAALVQSLAAGLDGLGPLRLGTDGNDLFAAYAGPDRMIGGRGDDIYFVDNRDDRAIETAGEGRDSVVAKVSATLWHHGQAIERLVLKGRADLSATGNGLDNVIRGNAGDNVIDGAWGDDILRGGRGDDVFRDAHGRDRMFGGKGNDLYIVDDPADRVFESRNAGRDTVVASVSFSLAAQSRHLEHLTLTGADDTDGTGNARANRIAGNDGDNRLDGLAGNDRLSGGEGDDILTGGPGRDWLHGGAGADTFVFAGRFGRDRIADFDPDEPGERIDLAGLSRIRDFADLEAHHLRQAGETAIIAAGRGDKILLHGVQASELTADDFIF